jgi:hypothetical protein
VALENGGEFVVVWNGPDGPSGTGVFARQFDTGGVPKGVQFQVNSYTSGLQYAPTVAVDADGDFVVAWNSSGQDGSVDGIFARVFDSAGNARTEEFQVTTYTTGAQVAHSVAIDDSGRKVVIAWSSANQDGNGNGAFAQRFVTLAVLDVDGNGSTDALTDGLLVLRFLFGFTGPTLVTGAVDLAACTRCDAATILPYLNSIDLDIDLNMEPDAPLTDGLLVLRFLFGFTGVPLVAAAVDLDDCDRCTAPEIQAHLQTLD